MDLHKNLLASENLERKPKPAPAQKYMSSNVIMSNSKLELSPSISDAENSAERKMAVEKVNSQQVFNTQSDEIMKVKFQTL